MSESRSSIILKRPKQRIGIDLVVGAVQETAAIVATDVVAVRGDHASVVRDVGTRARFQDGIPDRERPTDDNAAAVVAANGAIGDGAAAIDTATRQAGIVTAERAVSKRYATRDPASTPIWLAIMLGIRIVAADGAVDDRYRPSAGNAAASEIAAVAANRAIRNGQGSGAIDSAASTRGERIIHTSEVVVYCAVGYRQRPATVVDAPAKAKSKLVVAVERAVIAHAAVHQRHGRCAAIVVDGSSRLSGVVAADTTIENCQSGATPITIAIDRTAIGNAVGR